MIGILDGQHTMSSVSRIFRAARLVQYVLYDIISGEGALEGRANQGVPSLLVLCSNTIVIFLNYRFSRNIY